MHATSIGVESLFPSAAKLFIESQQIHGGERARYVKPRTISDFIQYSRALERFFGSLKLCEIHIGHIKEYQRLRSLGELGNPEIEEKRGKREVGPHKINQEVDLLRRIMRASNTWGAELEKFYQPLAVDEPDVPRALSPSEQDRFLAVAGSRSEWQLIHAYALLAFHTTASGCEMRGITIGDLQMHSGILMIRSAHSKNKYRVRTIPLSGEALWAGARLLEMAAEKGSREVHHYLFPFRNKRDDWDPRRPMSNSGIKKPWDEVRKAAGVPHFMPHDTRHTAITRLAEAGTPIPVIMSMAGHISRRMLLHYTHVSDQAKRMAIEAAFGGKKISTIHQFMPKSLKTS
jgi:integrase